MTFHGRALAFVVTILAAWLTFLAGYSLATWEWQHAAMWLPAVIFLWLFSWALWSED